MSKNTKIQWTDHSWSPWWGCTPVSQGCANCYAAQWAKFTRGLDYRKGVPRQIAKNWNLPRRWNADAAQHGVRPTIFPSMCDPFDEEVPNDWRLALFSLIKDTPNLDWLMLTKRPEAALRFYQSHVWTHSSGATLPIEKREEFTQRFLPNVWLGTSCENQEQADKRIPILLDIPAKVHFVSVEPMLGSVDLTSVGANSRGANERRGGGCNGEFVCNALTGEQPYYRESDGEPCVYYGNSIDWVIFGGESGPGARPCDLAWLRAGVRQCHESGVPPFVKQIGRNPIWSPEDMAKKWYERFTDKKGGNPDEWPEDLRFREVPNL